MENIVGTPVVCNVIMIHVTKPMEDVSSVVKMDFIANYVIKVQCNAFPIIHIMLCITSKFVKLIYSDVIRISLYKFLLEIELQL